jgi:hypothetical protein
MQRIEVNCQTGERRIVDMSAAEIARAWANVPDPATALAEARAAMVCTRRQGKLAVGQALWAQTEALLEGMGADVPWGLRVAIYDTQEWRRTDPDMQALIWALNLTDEQADDLFRLAATL